MGMITKELARKTKKVIAKEKDYYLYVKLKKKFELTKNIILYNADFLKFKIKEPYYKIFANIPFNITSAVIRKIVYAPNLPIDAYLILQKEALRNSLVQRKPPSFQSWLNHGLS